MTRPLDAPRSTAAKGSGSVGGTMTSSELVEQREREREQRE
ncbi:hypothetical protein CU044_0090 [Streptomyces sp. L-9-10]|nr:hypothetical protein CU044_0090 [Streptomyces sp. L-9-10]